METLTIDDLQTMLGDFMVIVEPGVHTEELYQKGYALRETRSGLLSSCSPFFVEGRPLPTKYLQLNSKR